MIDEFTSDLTDLINKHSKDNELNLPDWILARYLNDALSSLKVLNELKENYSK